MYTDQEIKEMVRQKYSEIASQNKETNASSCCGASGCSTEVYNIMSEEYNELEGYNPAAEMYAGCVASAIDKDEYLSYVSKVGFVNMQIQKNKPIIVPDDILKNYLNDDEIAQYKSNETVIRSITVYAEKSANCCSPNSDCC